MNDLDLFGSNPGSRHLSSSAQYDHPSFILPSSPQETVALEEEDQLRAAPSFAGLQVVLLLIASALIVQCFNLQIYQGSQNRALAEGNSLRLLSVSPDRGLIVDSEGTILARNTLELALAVRPQQLPAKRADRQPVYDLLKEKVGLDDATIELIEVSRKKSSEPFPIKTDLTKDESLLYREWFNGVQGVALQEIPIRSYEPLPSLGHLLGYVGAATEKDVSAGAKPTDQIGKTGVEAAYNQALTGTTGIRRVVVNARGEVQAGSQSANPAAVPGSTLRLSVDAKLQKIAAEALQHEIERRTKKFGASPNLGASVVAIDPSDGEVKALVSLPDYDANLFSGGISSANYQTLLNDPGKPLLDRAIAGLYPSGSVIKPVVAAAGLDAGVINANTQFVTPEAIYVGDFRFPDWKTHGLTNTRTAISTSNNIFFYAVGGGWKEKGIEGLGIDRLKSYMELFGIGKKSGVDLPGELSGVVPDDAWKRANVNEPWYIGDTYHLSIGQGQLLTNPLQLANATAAIMNGGTLWKPRLLAATIDPLTGKERLAIPEAIRTNVVQPEHLKVVWEGMLQTTDSGSARTLRTLNVRSGGKTGTAQYGTEGRTHAWYVGGVSKADNPDKPDLQELAFAILIEGGGESYQSSVPVAEEILRNYYGDPLAPGAKLNSEPDLGQLNDFQGER